MIRIGKIRYTNVLPIFHFMPIDQRDVLYFTEVPTVLNRMLAAGELDVAPISAFSYAEHAESYVALRGLSVASKGPVGSIFLFSKFPLDSLDGKRVALTNTSATSVNLLKVILHEHYQVRPNYVTVEPHLDAMMKTADAALLIGDDALAWSRKSTDYRVYDLGLEWYKRTGLPMVFAIWAMRKDFIQQFPYEAKMLHRQFLASKSLGQLHPEAIVQAAIDLAGEDEGFWKSYFSKLSHELHGEWRQGAETYFAAAYRQGLLASPVQLELWGE